MKTRMILGTLAALGLCATLGAAAPLAGMIASSTLAAAPDKEPKKSAPKKSKRPKVGDVAPAFSIPNADGKMVSLESLKGKIVLVDFWATWCGPCKAAMPKIQELHEEFKNDNVVVLGVQVWEPDHAKAQKYMESKKFTYGLLHGDDALADAYGLTGIPSIFLIDGEGKILFEATGLSPETEGKLRKAVSDAVAAAKKKAG
jgi:peroxiredoxin